MFSSMERNKTLFSTVFALIASNPNNHDLQRLRNKRVVSELVDEARRHLGMLENMVKVDILHSVVGGVDVRVVVAKGRLEEEG